MTREEVEKLLQTYSFEELIEQDYEDIIDFFTSLYELGLLTPPEVLPV